MNPCEPERQGGAHGVLSTSSSAAPSTARISSATLLHLSTAIIQKGDDDVMVHWCTRLKGRRTCARPTKCVHFHYLRLLNKIKVKKKKKNNTVWLLGHHLWPCQLRKSPDFSRQVHSL